MKTIESANEMIELTSEELESVSGANILRGIDTAYDIAAGFVAGVGAYLKSRGTSGGNDGWTGGDQPGGGLA